MDFDHKLGTLGFVHTCYQMEADQTALPRRRAEIVPAPHRKDIFLKKGKEIKLFEVEQAFKIWELGLKYVDEEDRLPQSKIHEVNFTNLEAQ